MQKDSVIKTLLVSAVLCVVCSVLVSGSAVLLKGRQLANIKLDIKKNLLLASGVIKGGGDLSPEKIEEAYKSIQAAVIDLESGEEASDMDAETFNQVKARKTKGMNKVIEPSKNLAGIKTRSKYSIAYKYIEDGKVKMLILPINGKGLWSTLYGFLALSPDTKVVQGIGFYQHGETPGLGGEVDNPIWKAKWKGKRVFDDDFQVSLKLIKGTVSATDSEKDYKIDGLSGATITSNGVTGLVRYWLGEDGFGPYLEKQRASLVAATVKEADLVKEVTDEVKEKGL